MQRRQPLRLGSTESARKRRVVSLLPSATETLCAIRGGAELLVGRSHEDNYPPSIRHLPALTAQSVVFQNEHLLEATAPSDPADGAMAAPRPAALSSAAHLDAIISASLASGESLNSIDEQALVALRPDIVLTQDLCSVCSVDSSAVVRAARTIDPPPQIVSLSPSCLEDVLAEVELVGEAVGLGQAGREARAALEARVCAVDERTAHAAIAPPSVAFLEWTDPLYIGGHMAPQLIARAGGTHPLNLPKESESGGAGKSYPIDPDALVASDPDLIILCPCGLDLPSVRREADRLAAKAGWWRGLRAVREGRVILVDGDAMFNRPGPRLVDALEWLSAIISQQPRMIPSDFPWEWLASDSKQTRSRIPQQSHASSSGTGMLPHERNGEGCREIGVPPNDDAVQEIERAHLEAVRRGRHTYVDPRSGFTVFTQLAGIHRGSCCGSGCRHCAFSHENVPPERRRRLAPPVTVLVE